MSEVFKYQINTMTTDHLHDNLQNEVTGDFECGKAQQNPKFHKFVGLKVQISILVLPLMTSLDQICINTKHLQFKYIKFCK